MSDERDDGRCVLCGRGQYAGMWQCGGETCTDSYDTTGAVTTTIWDWLAQLNAAGFAGHDDWRIPSAAELETIQTRCTDIPCVPPALNNNCAAGCTVTTCSCTQPSCYWSSTPDPPTIQCVNFGGNAGVSGPVGVAGWLFSVRAVRGGW
jgi:hypothetical protein